MSSEKLEFARAENTGVNLPANGEAELGVAYTEGEFSNQSYGGEMVVIAEASASFHIEVEVQHSDASLSASNTVRITPTQHGDLSSDSNNKVYATLRVPARCKVYAVDDSAASNTVNHAVWEVRP